MNQSAPLGVRTRAPYRAAGAVTATMDLPDSSHVHDRALVTAVRALRFEPSTRFIPGEHSAYGGTNWGVTFSPQFGDYIVNHGVGHDGPLPAGTTRWTADARLGDLAAELWAVRDDITAGLLQQGYGPNDETKIWASFVLGADAIVISPKDWGTEFRAYPVRRPRR